MRSVYISIGNSDDKLSQSNWSSFCGEVDSLLRQSRVHIHGFWLSATDSPWQNACWCFQLAGASEKWVRDGLADIAKAFHQDSITWAEAEVKFIQPS